MPLSWTSATLISVPKENIDQSHLSSYRPIALLNQDYKIFTIIMVNKIKVLITNYIKPDQMGFILKRNLVDNMHKILNIINYCSQRNQEVFSFDMEKAFDSMEIYFTHIKLHGIW